jgi:hypothetical protein
MKQIYPGNYLINQQTKETFRSSIGVLSKKIFIRFLNSLL